MDKWIEFLSTFPPRECGIATFCSDLVYWTQRAAGKKFKCKIIAMNNNTVSTPSYPSKVNYEIQESEMNDYLETAERINKNNKIKLVCVQHEFGIFGGDYGNYLLPFLDELKKPVVTTFHSVIPGNPKPEREMRYVVKKICDGSDKVVVISGFGNDILRDKYGIEPEKVVAIPHGVPNIPFGDGSRAKRKIGCSGRKLISTFGLLSKKKGIQYALKAMPKIIEKHPEALYLIIGETHPNVRKDEGESYRKLMHKMVKELGLKNNVEFCNRFLSIKELSTYLEATDVYITPYYDPYQISSGTLAYAVGAGKACVSTPYLYARDALRDNRGLFARFKNPGDIADKVNLVLDNPKLRKSLEFNAYTYSRAWQWESIGNTYLHLFKSILRK